MASKRDQLHAYQFMVQRVISALVARETDPEQPTFRRPRNAAFGGIALAMIALAAVGVYGIIVPGGNDSWMDGESVVVEEETGTRFVYLDQRLHPVANYTSALLAINKKADTKTVSRSSLLGVPRGPRIGIPDAPDSLPGNDKLLGDGWTLCSQPSADTTGTVVPRSVLMAGHRPATGRPLGDQAVLAHVPETGELFLLHHGFRHPIAAADTAAARVALRPTPAVRVGPAVIEALPAGRPFVPIPVAEAGKPSTAVPGRPDVLTGQLFVVTTSRGVQRYLAEATQLRPVTELQFDLQQAHQPGPVRPLGLAEAGAATQVSVGPAGEGDPPTERPDFAGGNADATLCLTFDPGATVPSLTIEPLMPDIDPMTATARRTERGVALADQIHIPAGHAIVVEAMPNEDAPAGTLMVVSDMGISYPLADPKILDVLGYANTHPVRMPATLVARIPMGSGLSHEAAMRR